MPTGYHLDEQKIFEIIRKARCPVEDHNLAERSLVERLPFMIQLNLDNVQYAKLRATLRRS